MKETYVTYKLWQGCSAPRNLEKGSRLIGERVATDVVDRDALLKVADEIEQSDVDGCVDWHNRIREALGVDE